MPTSAAAVAAREAKLDAVQGRLEAAVQSLVTGEDWMRAMMFAAKFRSRSFTNTLLIYAQHRQRYAEGSIDQAEPSYVAGYKQWETLDRHVVRGQKGYTILAPVTSRWASATPTDPMSWHRLAVREKARPGELVQSRMIAVKPAYVWDVCQTDGAPVPDRPHPVLLQGQAPQGLWDGLAAQVASEGFALSLVDCAAVIDGANGMTSYADATVQVRADMDAAARVKTLAHELAHVLLHAPSKDDGAVRHRGIGEVEAESVAMMVGAAHGMTTDMYTVPYVAGWASTVQDKTPAEVIQATGEKVRRTAMSILARLDTVQVGGGDPPGLNRQALTRYQPPHTVLTAPAPARSTALVLHGIGVAA